MSNVNTVNAPSNLNTVELSFLLDRQRFGRFTSFLALATDGTDRYRYVAHVYDMGESGFRADHVATVRFPSSYGEDGARRAYREWFSRLTEGK